VSRPLPGGRPAVAVCGPGGGQVPARWLADAEEVGRRLAAAGCVVVTGGLDGVMAAAVRGAGSVGATTVAVLPGNDPGAAAAGSQVVLPTGLGEARNVVLVNTVAGLVAVGGSWGTLSEVALACRRGIPVVSLHGWEVRGPGGGRPAGGPLAVATAEEAVTVLLGMLPPAPAGRVRPGNRTRRPGTGSAGER
jgi:uncharacterized protein (TIGR00725 family)